MSDEIVTSLVAETGREIGTRTSGRLRRLHGKTPATVYGPGFEPVSIAVDSRQLRMALSGEQGMKPEITLELGGKKLKAKVHQIQKHPVRHNVIHVDFLVNA